MAATGKDVVATVRYEIEEVPGPIEDARSGGYVLALEGSWHTVIVRVTVVGSLVVAREFVGLLFSDEMMKLRAFIKLDGRIGLARNLE